MKKIKFIALAILSTILPLTGCGNSGGSGGGGGSTSFFTYEDISFVDDIGSKTNSESYDYASIKVNKTTNELREDFAFGVDASMTRVVEKNGGVYYNERGQQQDVFQILRKDGVNFVRFRLWYKPNNILGQNYGGGDNNLATDILLAQRAKDANMNVMIDFHYSDFWADPETQRAPTEWAAQSQSQLPTLISNYTAEALRAFKEAGVTVDAVQIGNETNNGMAGFEIDWNNQASSFDFMARLYKAGISAAKSVFPKIKTMIHLANGGNADEFINYFSNLDSRNVNYDMIGASYYPHLSGSLDDLQNNLDRVSALTGKPVIVAETSWGFTEDYIEGVTENSYNAKDEEVGNYLTSIQAQATCLRDICDVLSKVPDNKGLGIFYWEPGWLPVAGDKSGETISLTPWATAAGQAYKYTGDYSYRKNYQDGLSTWSNQGLFSYTGKALPSLRTFSYVRSGFNQTNEQSLRLRHSTLDVTINIAAHESLPTKTKVETNLDAIRYADVSWNAEDLEKVKAKGTYNGLVGLVDNQYQVVCNAKCIENYVVDPGFENQGTTDTVKDPWHIDAQTPANDKVVKLDRKKDIRSGKTDLNWYHSSQDFSFEFSQSITLPIGNYRLSTYIVAPALTTSLKHKTLVLFMEINGVKTELDICTSDYLKGWSAGYQECVIDNIEISEEVTVRIGIYGSAVYGAWAHNDDWELVRND